MENQPTPSTLEKKVIDLEMTALTGKFRSKKYQRFLGIVAVIAGLILINRAGNMDTTMAKIGAVILLAGVVGIVLGFRGNAAIKKKLAELKKIAG